MKMCLIGLFLLSDFPSALPSSGGANGMDDGLRTEFLKKNWIHQRRRHDDVVRFKLR